MKLDKEKEERIERELRRLSSLGVFNLNGFLTWIYNKNPNIRIIMIKFHDQPTSEIFFFNGKTEQEYLLFDKWLTTIPAELRKEFIFNMDVWT